MNSPITILFYLLCISTVVHSTQSTKPDSKYDITKLLNNSIIRTFQSVDPYTVKKLIYTIENRDAINFETETTYDVEPFDNKFYFSGINVTVIFSRFSQLHYDFLSNKLVMSNPEFSIKLEAYVGPNKHEARAAFIRMLDFKNISITATKPPDNQPDNKFKIDISYDDVEFNYIYLPWFRDELTFDQQHELGEKIKEKLPSVFLHNINQNENFLQLLNKTFCKQASKKEIALTYTDFLHHEEQYYYRAQDVSSFHITLSNISINGLSNFKSFKFDSTYFRPNLNSFKFDTLYHQKYILVIENIRGNANLSYGTENMTIFELRFQTENVSIIVNKELQRVYVEPKNYSVIETKLNSSLTKRQSEWIMEGIGRAIAASVMPSMKICKNEHELSQSDLEELHPIVHVFGEISDTFHWDSINESFKDWTPFDGNYTATKLFFYPEPYNYSILIQNLSIFPEIQKQYPYQIECHFFKMLQIIYNIEGNATGQVRLQNTTDIIADIDFRARFSFADEIIKRKPNNNYEFKVWLAYYRKPIIVELLPNEYANDEKSSITKQIEETLLSMTRQIMLNNAEPILSLPLDFCIIPENLVDNFAPPFANYKAPYVIPHGAVHGGSHFSAKIYNISLDGLSNFDLARVAFNNGDTANFDDDSSDEAIGIFVEFPIYNISGRMGFNDSSVKFQELRLVRLNELIVVNATNEGRINVLPGHRYKLIPEPYDAGFSCYDSKWIMEKLEDIIENKLSKKKDDLLYSILS